MNPFRPIAEPKRRTRDLRGSRVEVEQPTEPRVPAHSACTRDSRAVNQPVLQTLMVSHAVVVCDELGYRAPEVASPSGMSRSRHSSFIDRTKRSAKAFAFGAAYGVCTTRIPPSASRSRTAAVHFASRSHINTRHGIPSTV